MVDNTDYVGLGLSCADVCRALARGVNGKRLEELSQSVYDATNRLTVWVEPATHISNRLLIWNALDCRTVADIQRRLVKCGKRNMFSGYFHRKKDKATIAAWKLDVERILQVFEVGSFAWVVTVADLPLWEGACNKHRCSWFWRSS
jgi:hypothetical protein